MVFAKPRMDFLQCWDNIDDGANTAKNSDHMCLDFSRVSLGSRKPLELYREHSDYLVGQLTHTSTAVPDLM